MPDNKRQHYVPKSVLRRFACDLDRDPEPRQINLVNISRLKIVREASLKEQCYRDYFYGQKTAVEKQLSLLEGFYSALTRKMIDTTSISDQDGWHIVQMISLQKGRTLRAEEEINATMEKLIKLAMVDRIEEADLRALRISLEGAAQTNVGQSLVLSPLLLDLKRFLIRNETSTPFIISDNPVALTNWFGHTNRDNRTLGFARSGLQLIMPLSPAFALLLHDGGTYQTHSERNIILLREPAHVRALNEIQWLNAYKNIYFSPSLSENDLRLLMNVDRPPDIIVGFERSEQRSDGTYIPTDKDEAALPSEGITEELVRVSSRELTRDARLPGVRIRRRPVLHDDGSMASPRRDPAWVTIVTGFADEISRKRIKFDDFWSFVERHPQATAIGPWLSRAERRAKRTKQ